MACRQRCARSILKWTRSFRHLMEMNKCTRAHTSVPVTERKVNGRKETQTDWRMRKATDVRDPDAME